MRGRRGSCGLWPGGPREPSCADIFCPRKLHGGHALPVSGSTAEDRAPCSIPSWLLPPRIFSREDPRIPEAEGVPEQGGQRTDPGRGSEQRWDGRSQQPTGHPFCLEDWPPWPWMPEPSRRQTRAWLWEEGRQRWCRQEVRAFHQAGPCEWGFSIPGQPWVGRGVRGGAVGDAGVTAHLTVSLHGPHGGALWKEARPG